MGFSSLCAHERGRSPRPLLLWAPWVTDPGGGATQGHTPPTAALRSVTLQGSVGTTRSPEVWEKLVFILVISSSLKCSKIKQK